MIQTAVTAQELYAKAALVDHEALARHQAKARAGGCRGVPEGGLRHRRAAGDSRVAPVEGTGRSSRCRRFARAAIWSGRRGSGRRRIRPRCRATRERSSAFETAPSSTYISGELLPGNVAIAGGRITYVGPKEPPAAEVLDATGMYLAPAWIEPHAHPWLLYNPVSHDRRRAARRHHHDLQ